MGTNYYLVRNLCPHCGRGEDRIHIGKSSGGWCFALSVGHDDMDNLNDWNAAFSTLGNQIQDEYGRVIHVDEMISTITNRSGNSEDGREPSGYKSWADFHSQNHSQRGPNNLLRSKVDGGRCIGHGHGTYDLFIGEFS